MVDEIKEIENNSLIEKAEAIAKRIEDANKRAEDLLKKQAEAAAKQILGGRSFAGNTEPVVDKDKEDKDYINKILASTGLKI